MPEANPVRDLILETELALLRFKYKLVKQFHEMTPEGQEDYLEGMRMAICELEVSLQCLGG